MGNVRCVREISLIRLIFLLGTEIILTQGVGICTESIYETQVKVLRWYFIGFPSAGTPGAPEQNVLRLHRKESEWAPMENLKGFYLNPRKGVAEAEALLSRFIKE